MLPNSALWNLELGRTASRSSAKNERLNAFALFVRFKLIERIEVVFKEDKVGLLATDIEHKSYPFKSSPTVWRTKRIRRLKIWCVCFYQKNLSRESTPPMRSACQNSLSSAHRDNNLPQHSCQLQVQSKLHQSTFPSMNLEMVTYIILSTRKGPYST